MCLANSSHIFVLAPVAAISQDGRPKNLWVQYLINSLMDPSKVYRVVL